MKIIKREDPIPMGLALVEVVVILGVAFVGLVLALPAVQAARGRAREADCVRNLKILGLALHNYHAVWNVLPMSAVAGSGHGNGHTGFAAILPYVEEQAVYNAYNFDLENWHAANATAVSSAIEVFLCPANRNVDPVPAKTIRSVDGQPIPGRSAFGRVHYGANWGGGHKGWGDDFVKEKGLYRGLMMTVVTPEGKDKARSIRLGDVTDGPGNTVMLVEKRDSFGWAVGGWGGSEFDVNTIPGYEGNDPSSLRVYSGSYHPDGPFAVMGDGSVRILPAMEDRALWYALITRDGGERIDPEDLPRMP